MSDDAVFIFSEEDISTLEDADVHFHWNSEECWVMECLP